MPSRIKPTAIYAGQGGGVTKIANVTGGSFSMTNDSEEMITEEGWIGATDGAVHGKISLQTVQIVGGSASQRTLEDAMLFNRYLKVKLDFNGRSRTVDAKVTSVSGDWKYQGGSYSGTVEMICGAPK